MIERYRVIKIMKDDKTCINRSTRFVIPSVAKDLTVYCAA